MLEMQFSRDEYNIALNTMDLIISGELKNPYDNFTQFESVKNKIRTFAYIRYDEVDRDIIRIKMTGVELKIFATMIGYGTSVTFDNMENSEKETNFAVANTNFAEQILQICDEINYIRFQINSICNALKETKETNKLSKDIDATLTYFIDISDTLVEVFNKAIKCSDKAINNSNNAVGISDNMLDIYNKILSEKKYENELIAKLDEYKENKEREKKD